MWYNQEIKAVLIALTHSIKQSKTDIMKARIRYVSNDSITIMNFETLEDLLKWKNDIGKNIIIEDKISWFDDEDFDLYIQVYDDYRE